MFTNSKLFSFEEGTAHNNEIEIYYRDYGPTDGDPILLVQGIGGQLINWPQHLIEFLITIILDQLYMTIATPDYLQEYQVTHLMTTKEIILL